MKVTTVTAHAIATSIRSTFRCMFSRKNGSWSVAASRATIGRHAAISIGTEDHLQLDHVGFRSCHSIGTRTIYMCVCLLNGKVWQ